MIGKTVAQYEILDQLGMGVICIVYKAKDTNLGRIVALKFLPQNILVSDDDKARFRREAQAAASLNHPNICTIHDLGETEDGNTYIAMEHVDGPTLRHEIEKGPMKLDRAISITVQIAKGLQAAHSVDIVHRDIKSANIMLNAEGQVKIMDFGLAKTAQSTQLTKTGSTLGTFTFMSPEQARGDQVDHRTDIWSLGVVLYELVTGRLPFGGEYEQAMVYSILNQDPEPLTALRTGVPVALDWIMAKLLSKDPARRYQSASEAAIDLESIDLQATGLSSVSMISGMSGVSQGAGPAVSFPVQSLTAASTSVAGGATTSLSQKRLIPIGIGLVIVAAALGWLLKPAPPLQPAPVMRFQSFLPDGIDFSNQGRHSIAVSPNGAYYAYVADRQIYMGEFESGQPASLVRGSEEGREVFFSPDSRWLGFEYSGSGNESKLMKSAVAGGSPIPLASIGSIYGSHWSTNGWIYVGQGTSGIYRVSETGGSPEIVLAPDTSAERSRYNQPQLLPGEQYLLYSKRPEESSNWDDARIEILNLESGVITPLPINGNDARYLASGHLVYGFGGTIYGASFDPSSLRMGAPVPLLEGVYQSVNSGNAGPIQFSSADSGLMAWLPGQATATRGGWGMVWVDESGREEPLFSDEGFFFQPRLSPDASRLAVYRFDGGRGSADIWIYDVARGSPILLADELDTSTGHIWSPSGQRIAFSASADSTNVDEIWVRDSHLGTPPVRLFAYDVDVAPESWSLDERYIAFSQFGQSGDILIYDLESDSSSPFLATGADEFQAAFSPDGNWLAYISDVSGQYEVYIRPFPGPGGVFRASDGGGASPVWSADGNTIYYQNLDDVIFSVDVAFSPDPVFENPKKIYEGEAFVPSPFQGVNWGPFDVDRTNTRFIMMSRDDVSGDSVDERDELRFVVNWFAELKRLVPPLD